MPFSGEVLGLYLLAVDMLAIEKRSKGSHDWSWPGIGWAC
jgi:hypothetical protein